MFLMMKRALLMLPIMFCWGECVHAQIRVTSDFPGGSAVVVSVDDAQQSLHIRPVVQKNRGWPCWWYCRVDGLSVGDPVKVTVSANPNPFRRKQVLDHTWVLPERASISDDNIEWRQTSVADREAKTATYEFEASAETMWVAWRPPFLPAHSEALLTQVAKTLPNAEVFELARTRADRPVHAIRLGARPTKELQPAAIWVQARQHAWEAGSSWVAQGFLKWVASDDLRAIELRSKATICVGRDKGVRYRIGGMGKIALFWYPLVTTTF
jgi:hypothetical protein